MEKQITIHTICAIVAFLTIVFVIESSSVSNHDHCKAQQKVSYGQCMHELMPR